MFNFWRRGTIPLSDNNLANAFAYQPRPVVDALGHSQYRYTWNVRALQPPQLMVQFAWQTNGLGGLVAGGTVFQGLGQNPNPGQA
jgi:hypothetical protein